MAPVGRLWAGFWGVLGGTLGSLWGLLRPLGWFLGGFLALDAVRHGFRRILVEIRVRSWGSKIVNFKSYIVKIEDPRGYCKKLRFGIDFRSQNEAFSDHANEAKIWFSHRRGALF